VLTVKAEHLDSLITTLRGFEYHASLLDPIKGQQSGEHGQIRTEIVDYQIPSWNDAVDFQAKVM
jgi:hypothetical protein